MAKKTTGKKVSRSAAKVANSNASTRRSAAKSRTAKKGTGSSKTVKVKAASSVARKNDAVDDLVYVAESPLHGKGLFARQKLKANMTLGKLEGRPIRRDGTYVLWFSDTDGLRVTNDFRFINHSSKPNCALTGTKVVTLKSVKADEELTHDYGW